MYDIIVIGAGVTGTCTRAGEVGRDDTASKDPRRVA